MTLQLLSTADQGFETGLGTWVAQTNCAVAQSAVQAQAGTKSMTLTSTAGGLMSAITGNYPVMPGRTYLWSSYWRSVVSARATIISVYWFQSDGTTASAIRANDDAVLAADSTSAWTQSALGSAVAPLDAFYAKVRAQVTATGAGAEVHYLDTVSFQDSLAPFFKHGKFGAIWLDGRDMTPYFNGMDFNVKVDTADVSTFTQTVGATWKAYLTGLVDGGFQAAGFWDPTIVDVKTVLLAVTTNSVITTAPAGAFAIGDQMRLHSELTSDYKESSKIGSAVITDWTVDSTSNVGIGECLHVMGPENVGTITGTGSPLLQGISTATGAIFDLHVTAYTAGTQNFKLQDAPSLNGAYVDIAGGAFTAVSAVGAQRLVVAGTIRAYVRAVATIATAACTYGIAGART